MKDSTFRGGDWGKTLLAAGIAGFMLCGVSCAASGQDTISLAGQWRFAADPSSQGLAKEWFKTTLPDTIRLPGSTAEQGKGAANDRPDTNQWSPLFNSLPSAWYQRDVTVPADWAGKRVSLLLERTKLTRVWVDGQAAGQQSGVCTAQAYDLTDAMKPGTHVLTVQVALGPFPKGIGGHHLGAMQTNWNGIIGRLELSATPAVWIGDVQVLPDVAHKSARIFLTIGNATAAAASGTVTMTARSWNCETKHAAPPVTVTFTAPAGQTPFETVYAMGQEALLWDEFSPAMYKLSLELEAQAGEAKFKHSRDVDFGLREFRRSGTQFAINGNKTFLRGTHDGCHFPLTGYPPMDTAEWVRLFRIARSYGINHYRFHTWCPPEAALAAGDIVGMYLQPELPSSAGFAFAQDANHDAFCRAEGERILLQWGNHPSLVMLALGNEIGIPHPQCRAAMTEIVSHFRQIDPTRLYAEGSNNEFGNPTVNPNDDYFTTFRTGRRTGAVRGSFATVDSPLGHVQAGPAATTFDYCPAVAGISVPVIGHEVGQYTVFPNFRETSKYNGLLRLRNYDVFAERLKQKGMLDQADDFVRASGALAALCYREEVEAALRTTGFGGFQLLDLADNQEQGSAIVGLLDSFMDSKGLIAPAAWREFCGPTVPLALMPRYTWTTADAFTAEVKVANYGPQTLAKTVAEWSLKDSAGKEFDRGELPAADAGQGRLASLGTIKTDLSNCQAPQKLTLEIRLKGTPLVNHYPVWVYPARPNVTPPPTVIVTGRLDAKTLSALSAGRSVVLFAPSGSLANCVGGGFATDFWCWPMFHNTPGTMGILCDPRHAALESFPTEFHSNWQWFGVVTKATPVILDDAPADFRPIVQVIDNFGRNHKLGLVFETKVGRGKLLVCACDLPAMAEVAEARQLMSSLLAYAGSSRFQPAKELPADVLKKLGTSASR